MTILQQLATRFSLDAWFGCAVAAGGCSGVSSGVCSPMFWFLEVQGSLTLLVLGMAWLWASQSRVRESRRIKAAEKAGNAMAFVNPDSGALSHEKQQQLPKVSVVLAVKGAEEQSQANWRSQLVTLYGGELEYIFCVESEDDPAYDAVQVLQKEMEGLASVRLVVAGLATSCSQQIHNQLAGAKAADDNSKYLLFLDDDIQCHPGTISSLVDAMEKQSDVFVCTGYSFDVPSSPSLAAYAAMAYRLPLLVGMSSGGRAFFVWGGCIMIRMEDLREDRHGMATALKKNGYSNDLILTSVAGVNNRVVWCPAAALFPGRMSGNWTFMRYWNYVRRQIFALLTYCSGYAYRTNRLGWLCYSYFAMAAVLPLLSSLVLAAYSLAPLLKSGLLVVSAASVGSGVWRSNSGIFDPSAEAGRALAEGTAVGGMGAGLTSLSPLKVPAVSCPVAVALAWFNLACFSVAVLCAMRLFHAALTLCNLLSPEKRPIQLNKLSIFLGIGGMLLNLALLPVIAVYTLARADITWAGIRYVRRRGVVASVEHPPQQVQLAEERRRLQEQKQRQQEELLETVVVENGKGGHLRAKVPSVKAFAAGDAALVADLESQLSLLAGTPTNGVGSVGSWHQGLESRKDQQLVLLQQQDQPQELLLSSALLPQQPPSVVLPQVSVGGGVLESRWWWRQFPMLGRTLSPEAKKTG